MAGWMMDIGTWQGGCWKHGRLDAEDRNMAEGDKQTKYVNMMVFYFFQIEQQIFLQ